MNINEYIESGILDVYVLGGLSAEESKEVEVNAFKYPEISKEINSIMLSIEDMTLSSNMSPSFLVKERIFEHLDNHKSENSSYVLSNKNLNTKIDFKKFKTPYLAIAASWLITLLTGSLAYYYKQQWNHTEGRLIALQNNNRELATNFNTTKNSYDQVSSQLAAINDSSIRIVTLKAVPGKPSVFAQVLWSKTKHQVYVNANSLPGAPQGKQYQLWAIVNGKPVDAGLISSHNANQLSQMKDVNNPTAFAITLENEGGSDIPTMNEMYVMGLI